MEARLNRVRDNLMTMNSSANRDRMVQNERVRNGRCDGSGSSQAAELELEHVDPLCEEEAEESLK